MKVEGLRSPYQKVANLYHLGRMLDKIRLRQAERLRAEYIPNFGLTAGEGRCQGSEASGPFESPSPLR
jgi:hypothetical protein